MKNTNKSELPPILYAEASVHSIGGESVFTTSKHITSETVKQFYSEKNMVQEAVEKLKEYGFDVLNIGDVTISIAASPEIYEKVFHTKIVPKEREVQGVSGKSFTTTLDSTNSEMPGLISTENSALSDVLEGIAINEKVFVHSLVGATIERTLNDMPGRLSPNPPKKEYYHLEPPQDLVKLLLAERAHQSGVTGQGIKVVMVDSGFFRHPFFTENEYHANPVVLGPGTSDAVHDKSGHGTGQSVNVFSLAPDVDFTMVKMNNFEAVGAFDKAVARNPDIITCSWGLSTAGTELSAQQKTLELAVANAVNKGITVVFSTGNGGEPFPGMHPDVISVGGVFVHEDGSMEATPYASGYESKIYRNRQIPDVCGLVGLPPKAAYIMLPVEPGDKYDQDYAGSQHPQGDETSPIDGWAAFSGTSAAAPQIAGICALLKQVNRRLTAFQIRDILKRTARDVIRGHSAQSPAHQGRDLATGFGLVDASRAVDEAKRMI